MIDFEIVITTNKNEMMMKKKVSIKNKKFYIFKVFDVKNSAERISAKFIVDNTTIFLNIFENLSFNFKKFLK